MLLPCVTILFDGDHENVGEILTETIQIICL